MLAQFGGVTLAFAFIATIAQEGFDTLFVRQHGVDVYPNGIWLFKAHPGLASALALAMIVIVATVMVLYSLLQRRTSRWLR